MSELLKKYESIDQSKLNEATIKIINRVKTITADFTADDKKNNEIAEQVLDSVMQKNPDAIKIVKREPKAKPAPKKTHKATHTAKTTHKAKSAPATKNSDNNIMTVAKQIQKSGETWKDAMERAKVVLKERREQGVQKQKTELEKLYNLVKTKKELQGFANSDIKRDAVREAKVSGARFVSKEGSTSNAYGTFPNKIGRKYWETRDRHADRLAPNYPKDMPLLAKGGNVNPRYFLVKMEDEQAVNKVDKLLQKECGDYEHYEVGNQNGRIYRFDIEDIKKWNEMVESGHKNYKKIIDYGHLYSELDLLSSNNRKVLVWETDTKSWKKNYGTKYADGGDIQTNNTPIFIVEMHNSASVTKVDKLLSEYGIEIDNSKKWHTKGYGAEYKGDGDYDYPFTYVFDVRDSKDTKELENKIFALDSKSIDVTAFGKNPYEFADGGSTEKYKVGQKFYDTRYDKTCEIVPSSYDGVVTWKRYNKSGTGFENDSEHILVENQFDYLVNMGAYQLSKQSMANGGMSNLTIQNVSFAKGGKVKHTFKVGEIVSFPTQKNRYMDKPLLDMINHFSNKELVIEKINEDKPYNLADVYIKDTGEKLRDLILNPKVLKIYPDNVEDEKNVKIKDWYLKNYPTDDLGEEIDDNNTFQDMWTALHNGTNVYDILGVGDSLVRERVFEEVSKINGVDYEYVYKKWLDSDDYANGGSLPFMTDPNFGNFQNTGAFADGGYFDKLEDVKFLFNVGEKIKIPQMEKGKLQLVDAEVIEQYPAEQNDGTYFPFYYVRGYWENAGKSLYDEEKLLEYGNKPKNSFELGGAFMMTDLAGHTGGSDGLGNPTPLSGVSGTYYTGLVGETGAMSSGELFMDGGAMAQNQQVINDASQSYVNYYLNDGGGVFKDGGAIKNQYEGRTPEDVWNNWTISQKEHFVSDHFEVFSLTIPDFSDWFEKYGEFAKNNASYDTLPPRLKSFLKDHISEGQYAKGGALKDVDDNLYVSISKTEDDYWFITSKPTTKKQAEEMAELVTPMRGEVNDVKTVGQVKAHSKVIYENGGAFAPNVSNGTQFMNGVYADGGVINGELNKKIQKLADVRGFEIGDWATSEYNKIMTQALVESLTDANYHDEAKEVVAKAEKKEWSDELYESEYFNPDEKVSSFAREVARICEWDGDDIVNAYFFITKMAGSKVGNMIEDLFLNKKSSNSTSSSKPTKYIDHDDIKSVTLKLKGKIVTVAGSDVLNGANILEDGGDLSKIANYVGKNDVVSVELKNGENIKPANGYWVKKGAKPLSTPSSKPVSKTDETKAHFQADALGNVFVDSNFVNQSQGNLPNTELKHYGYGDFYLQTPDGNIEFIRTNEEKVGFVGRTHKMKGSDELVLKLVNAMKEKGRFESTQIFAKGGEMEGTDITAELEDFDIDNLDDFETMQYNQFLKSSGKVGALQVLINSVEGDYSQLSPELAELAEKQMSGEEWDEMTTEQIREEYSYAKGGMFDDNEGFMRADNENNYRFPESNVQVDTLDEPIDLTSNVTLRSNRVVINPINENIDLTDDNRVRATMGYNPKNRTPEKMMMVNQRMVITDLPKPTSNTHKND